MVAGLLLGVLFTATGAARERSLLAELETEVIGIVEKAAPAVVSITTELVSPRWWADLEEERFPAWIEEFLKSDFGSRKRRSTGTGFIISPDGKILTTEHVVDRGEKISVTLHDGRVLAARVVGLAPIFNIALLKVDGKDLPHLSLGTSGEVRHGSWAIALGQPFGLATSASWGIVSGLSRTGLGIAPYEELIQITAPINPGDSGGPLLNSRGEVIGIIAASFTGYREHEFDWDLIRRFHHAFPRAATISPGFFLQDSQAQGVGFAIAIDLVKKVIATLEKDTSRSWGWLGLYPEALPGNEGLSVTALVPDGPAARAGLQGGDIILAVNGQPVKSPLGLQKMILFTPVGETIAIAIRRDGESKTLQVTIEAQAESHQGE
jgi:serine protease Do